MIEGLLSIVACCRPVPKTPFTPTPDSVKEHAKPHSMQPTQSFLRRSQQSFEERARLLCSQQKAHPKDSSGKEPTGSTAELQHPSAEQGDAPGDDCFSKEVGEDGSQALQGMPEAEHTQCVSQEGQQEGEVEEPERSHAAWMRKRLLEKQLESPDALCMQLYKLDSFELLDSSL